MKYEISEISGLNRASKRALMDLGKLNGLQLKFGEGGRLGKGRHMANHEHTPKFELDWVCGWIGNLIRLNIVMKYSKKPRE